MNSDIDWIFAFIEIAIGIYSLLKGMIDFTYSGLPKYSNGNTSILNQIKSFEYLHEAFCTRRNLCIFSLYLCILIHSFIYIYFEISNSLKMITTARENK